MSIDERSRFYLQELKILVHGGSRQTFDLLLSACLLALSRSGRSERTAVCTLRPYEGPIAGCSAVLEVRE